MKNALKKQKQKKRKIATWEQDFEQFCRENPKAEFGQYYAQRLSAAIANGKSHTTLGANLITREDRSPTTFEESGRGDFEMFRSLTDLKPQHKVVDYGCGSLRLGIHFMNYLEPGNYFGLDVAAEFIDAGKTLVGDALANRRPHVATTEAKAIAEAKSFTPDFVISKGVSWHIHPRECEIYFANLQNIASKPGAALLFDAKLAEKPIRYAEFSWARPLEFYVGSLPELTYRGQKQQDVLEFARM